MSEPRSNCPACGSSSVVKNGKSRSGKQNHRCRNCGRQFVDQPANTPISEKTKRLIDKLLFETISIDSISRITGVSPTWLYSYLKIKLRSYGDQSESE